MGLRARVAARGYGPGPGVVPDHGAGRAESHPEIPDRVLPAVGPAEKPALDGTAGADGAARHPTPAERSADADRVPQSCGRTYRQQTLRVRPDSLRTVCGRLQGHSEKPITY